MFAHPWIPGFAPRPTGHAHDFAFVIMVEQWEVTDVAGNRVDLSGRVVIVTGAGRGLGAAYAAYLTSRGAQVIVNDIGCTISGEGRDPSVSRVVAESISRAGGIAVADSHDMRDHDGPQSIIETALTHFGRIDAVVHNAGLNTQTEFTKTSDNELSLHLSVDPIGPFRLTQAVWPHFVEQGYGRLVFSVSGGMLGLPMVTGYGTAKGATWALARCLASAAPEGIRVNAISPVAFTRMTTNGSVFSEDEINARRVAHAPEAVAPLVAVLVDENCPTNGELFAVGGGLVSRIFVSETAGYADFNLTPEKILSNWPTVMAPDSTCTPTVIKEQPRRFSARMPTPTQSPFTTS